MNTLQIGITDSIMVCKFVKWRHYDLEFYEQISFEQDITKANFHWNSIIS